MTRLVSVFVCFTRVQKEFGAILRLIDRLCFRLMNVWPLCWFSGLVVLLDLRIPTQRRYYPCWVRMKYLGLAQLLLSGTLMTWQILCLRRQLEGLDLVYARLLVIGATDLRLHLYFCLFLKRWFLFDGLNTAIFFFGSRNILLTIRILLTASSHIEELNLFSQIFLLWANRLEEHQVARYLFLRYWRRLVNHSHLNLAAKLIVEKKFVELSVLLRSHGLLQNIQIKWLGQLFKSRLTPMHVESVEWAHWGQGLA